MFLHRCDSARGTADDVFASPAAALVRAGVSRVIAMQFPIKEEAAIQLSSVIYVAERDGRVLGSETTCSGQLERPDARV